MTDTVTPSTALPEKRGSAGMPVSRVFGLIVTAAALLWLAWDSGFKSAIILAVLVKAGIYAISAMGLNLHFGFTGLLNFGHVAFMAVGAYTTALLIPHSLGRAGTESGTWALVPALIGGMVVAALLGLLLGIPTLRLRGDSPGCCTLTNIVRPSGVKLQPVISQPTGPTRKRRTSPLAGSQASNWLLPRRAISP